MITPLVLAFLVAGCGGKKKSVTETEGGESDRVSAFVEMKDVEFRNGLVYKRGEKKPFSGTIREKHANGERQSEVRVKDGKPHGTMKGWHADGSKRLQAKYANGALQTFDQWDEIGNEVDGSTGRRDPFLSFVGGIGSGGSSPDRTPDETETISPVPVSTVGSSDPSGEDPGGTNGGDTVVATAEEVREVNGRALVGNQPFSGRLVKDLNNGVRSERHYANGLPHGAWTTYYPNGQKRSEEHYVGGTKEGSYTLWFENGQPRFSTEFADGRENGITTHWDQDGNITGRWQKDAQGNTINLLEQPGTEAGSGENP